MGSVKLNTGCKLHRLFLIRHGETVDNVAGLYAGIRDSALTNHGVQQANRLGQYFARSGISFTNVFSSDLNRAIKTAEIIRSSQTPANDEVITVHIPELREQNFGYYEGKPFYARPTESTKSGKEALRDKHKSDPGFQDMESRTAMAKRADTFLDGHLLPLLHNMTIGKGLVIAIVSHGILLSSLWRCLLRRQLPNTVSIDHELLTPQRSVSLEHLGGWSNTGYLELELRKISTATIDGIVSTTLNDEPAEPTMNHFYIPGSSVEPPEGLNNLSERLSEWTAPGHGTTHNSGPLFQQSTGPSFEVVIKIINGREHLKGLKRTGGGVGSSKFEEGQKSIKTFFKKQRTT